MLIVLKHFFFWGGVGLGGIDNRLEQADQYSNGKYFFTEKGREHLVCIYELA